MHLLVCILIASQQIKMLFIAKEGTRLDKNLFNHRMGNRNDSYKIKVGEILIIPCSKKQYHPYSFNGRRSQRKKAMPSSPKQTQTTQRINKNKILKILDSTGEQSKIEQSQTRYSHLKMAKMNEIRKKRLISLEKQSFSLKNRQSLSPHFMKKQSKTSNKVFEVVFKSINLKTQPYQTRRYKQNNGGSPETIRQSLQLNKSTYAGTVKDILFRHKMRSVQEKIQLNESSQNLQSFCTAVSCKPIQTKRDSLQKCKLNLITKKTQTQFHKQIIPIPKRSIYLQKPRHRTITQNKTNYEAPQKQEYIEPWGENMRLKTMYEEKLMFFDSIYAAKDDLLSF